MSSHRIKYDIYKKIFCACLFFVKERELLRIYNTEHPILVNDIKDRQFKEHESLHF